MAGPRRRSVLLPVALLVSSVLAVLAVPAAAQFGPIFGGPPRPPGDIPVNRDPRLPPPVYQDRDPRYDPRQPEPPPPPLTRFPSSGPRPPGVQTQPLPPPPGTAPPPLPPAPDFAGRPPPDVAGRPPSPASPGLPPGQRQPRGAPQPGNTAPQSGDEVVVAPPSQKVVNPTAVFAGLDKITGRIISFDVAIDETVQFGALRLTPRTCYTRPPTETPNTDGFIEVDEITLQGEVKRIFTGWMFASSPGLHGIEHSIYDVWLTDCKKDTPMVAATPGPRAEAPQPAAAPVEEPPPAGLPQPAPRQTAPGLRR